MSKKIYPEKEEHLPTLQETLREEYGRKTIEERTQLPLYFSTALNPAFKLRPYQEQCFKYFINYWENDFEGKEAKPQLLFHMATGSGKTLIMAGLMLYLYEKGYRNFLFFVNSSNIIEKTKDNLLNTQSGKYLFAPTIKLEEKTININFVNNFQSSDDSSINLCLTTIQALHTQLNTPKENAITYDDFADKRVVLISDEAHHINTATKKGKAADINPTFFDTDTESSDWEETVMRIFHANGDYSMPNVLLEFTATADLTNANVAEKYQNKIIFDYPLKKFREDGYSKDIEVVQSDLSPIDRAIQTVILSQYKRKLLNSIGQNIKPVMMFKSKTINANKEFHSLFVETIRRLSIEEINKIAHDAKNDIADAFSFFQEHNISFDNLLLEIKEDFKEENLLLVDGNNISPEKQLQLNSLEDKNNEFRCVFAVDMLNEGWDVLNLYDIVRLYNTRDAKAGVVGKTTMSEAQLIGRGARYMPFTTPDSDAPKGQRKFDNDVANRLRVVEKLHYHSESNSRYIDELKTALTKTGAIAEKTKRIKLTLKESFKNSKMYKEGYVLVNDKEPYIINEDINQFGDEILNTIYKVRLKTGEVKSSMVFEKTESDNIDISIKTREFLLSEMGNHVIRAALNTLEQFKFENLRESFPPLESVKYFIGSPNYLANIKVLVAAKEETLFNLTQRQKLGIVIEVLKQIEPKLGKSSIGYRGTKRFKPKDLKSVIMDKELQVSLDGSSDKEYGKSMKESSLFLQSDLMKHDWFAFEDFFGTSEEKHLIKYIEQVYPKLAELYEDIHLVRSEREVKIYNFSDGQAFEPDFLLFMRKKEDERYLNMQVFIEPKGAHLALTDKWKEDLLVSLSEHAEVFETIGSTIKVWGLPFYTEAHKDKFDRAFKNEFEVCLH